MSEIDHSTGQVVDKREFKKLQTLEKEIEKNLQAPFAIGRALQEIKTQKLYLEAGFNKFSDYYKHRWGFKETQCKYLMDAYKVVDTLKLFPEKGRKHEHKELLNSVSWTRPLSTLSSPQILQVWGEVVEKRQPITAKLVEETVKIVMGEKPKKESSVEPKPKRIEYKVLSRFDSKVEEICEKIRSDKPNISKESIIDALFDIFLSSSVPIIAKKVERQIDLWHTKK